MAVPIHTAQFQEGRWEERLLNLWNYPKYTVWNNWQKKKKKPKTKRV